MKSGKVFEESRVLFKLGLSGLKSAYYQVYGPTERVGGDFWGVINIINLLIANSKKGSSVCLYV